MPAAIVDDQGFVVTKAKRGMVKSLRFNPSLDSRYVAPLAEQLAGVGQQFTRSASAPRGAADAFVGQHYFLEIFPTTDTPLGQPLRIGVQMANQVATELHDIT